MLPHKGAQCETQGPRNIAFPGLPPPTRCCPPEGPQSPLPEAGDRPCFRGISQGTLGEGGSAGGAGGAREGSDRDCTVLPGLPLTRAPRSVLALGGGRGHMKTDTWPTHKTWLPRGQTRLGTCSHTVGWSAGATWAQEPSRRMPVTHSQSCPSCATMPLPESIDSHPRTGRVLRLRRPRSGGWGGQKVQPPWGRAAPPSQEEWGPGSLGLSLLSHPLPPGQLPPLVSVH